MFGSAPLYDVLTSCTRSSYTPWYKTEMSRTDKNRGKPCRVCKNYIYTLLSLVEWSAWSVPSACELHGGACLSHIVRNCSTGRLRDCNGTNYYVFMCSKQCCDPCKLHCFLDDVKPGPYTEGGCGGWERTPLSPSWANSCSFCYQKLNLHPFFWPENHNYLKIRTPLWKDP